MRSQLHRLRFIRTDSVDIQALERLDAQYRRNVLLAAMTDVERGIAARGEQNASTDALERDYWRLVGLLADELKGGLE